jgi:uncharacterized repeat protein (TIGR01451 family)
MGVMRGIAQPEPPVLKPDQLKPTTYAFPKSAAPAPLADTSSKTDAKILPPDQIDKIVPPDLDAQPVVPASQPLNLPINMPKEENPAAVQPAPNILAVPTIDPQPAIKAPVLPPSTLPVVEPRVKVDAPSPNAFSPSHDVAKPAMSGHQPGNRVTPSVSIETIAPESAPFAQPVSYEIVVRNTGSTPVTHVRVDDEIAAGTAFIRAEPAAQQNGEKVLWMLGSMNAGEEKRIRMTVKAGEGDLTLKPRVTFSSGTTTSVRVTRPNLAITVNAPEIALVGDEVPLKIQVTNTGTGEASRVVLKAVLTEGLKHSEGNDIQAPLNRLAPGESQTVTLRVEAALAGMHSCSLSAMTEGSPKAMSQIKIDIRQPKLTLAIAGPPKCFVRMEPVYTVEVANPGSSATEPVSLAIALPPEGIEFASASDSGAYDSATRTISWNLGPAAAGTKRTLTVKAKSTVAGQFAVRAVAQAGSKLNARAESVIHADGVPALSFEVVDHDDPVEVGKEVMYDIKLVNTGTMQCTNIRVTASVSEGLQPTQISSNVAHKLIGQTLVFDPIAKLPVKGEMIIKVKAKGTHAGDHRFKVQLSYDQMKQPVLKEESTSFFQP